jgi:hypothetical protein
VAYKYALPGPPFNFLGNFSETQRDKFKEWIDKRKKNFGPEGPITLHHRIRAQQLRKTAGVLEEFYGAKGSSENPVNDQKLDPSFVKPSWQPGKDGHFNYTNRNDHLPMVMVGKIKTRFKEQLQRDEEGVFFMNHVRTLIEKHEDFAQFANDVISDTNKENLQTLLTNIDTYFGQPQYEAALVKDKSDLYKGEPRYRVNQLDEPTVWEKEQVNHSDRSAPIAIKQVDPEQDPLP